MTTPAEHPVCDWHRNRVTYVLCSRCGRSICPDCMTTAPVGFHCPDCIRQGRPTRKVRSVSAMGAAVVTKWLMLATIAGYALQLLFGDELIFRFGLEQTSVMQGGEYYRVITWLFLHGSLMHIAFNMLILYQIGMMLEPAMGSRRFAILYFASGFGAALVSMYFAAPYQVSVGASGAIFGLMGGFVVVAKRHGIRPAQMQFWIGLNLVIGFIVPGVDWHGHVGGLLTGLAVATLLDHK